MPVRNAPSALDDHLGYWLRLVSNQVSLRFQQLLAAQDVSAADWVALRTLWGGSQSTHAALIDALGMTKGAASKLVTRLENKGLAERLWVEGQARVQWLRLTPKGRALVPKLAALADANEAHCFAPLNPAQQEALRLALQALALAQGWKEAPTT